MWQGERESGVFAQFWLNAHESEPSTALGDFVKSRRGFTGRMPFTYRLFITLIRVPTNRSIDHIAVSIDTTNRDCEILFLDIAIMELFGQLDVDGIVLATTMTPLVSRSSRWTIPGLVGPPMSESD